MTVNISSMILNLSRKIQTATSSEDILILSKAVELLQSGAVFTVPTVLNLPVGDSARSKQLVLVVADQQLYVYRESIGQWVSIASAVAITTWAWGNNGQGRLGDGTTTARSSPVSVIGGITDWSEIAAGREHGVALRTTGTLWSWGSNNLGQLGHGTAGICSRSSPVSVIGGITDWCGISAGYHNLAIRSNGTLWAWGPGNSGALGVGDSENRFTPAAVVGGFTDWCQASASFYLSLGIRTNGTLWSWGRNSYGQLGQNTCGTGTNRSSPVSVVGGFTDWSEISAGSSHSLALRSNGTAWSWGRNNFGQLGHNTATTCSRSSPVSVIGGFADWCAIAAGDFHSLAIRTNGTAWSWGSNTYGRLGDGTVTDRSSPVSVIGGITDWCAVSAGDNHSLALRTNGTAWSWGSNFCGRLGDGTVTGQSSPVSVIGGFTDWYQVSAGSQHSLALRTQSL